MKLTQTEQLKNILESGQAYRSDDLVQLVYGEGKTCPTCGNRKQMTLARLGARVWDLKEKYGWIIEGKKDPINKKLYWYQRIIKVEAPKQAVSLFQ